MRRALIASLLALVLAACGGGGTSTSSRNTTTTMNVRQFASIVSEWRTKIDIGESDYRAALHAATFLDIYAAFREVSSAASGLASALILAGTPPAEISSLVTRTIDAGVSMRDEWTALYSCAIDHSYDAWSYCERDMSALGHSTESIVPLLDAWKPYTT
jgi:hypothetical protein